MKRLFFVAAVTLFSTTAYADGPSPLDFFVVKSAPYKQVKVALPPSRPFNLPPFVRGRLVCAVNVNKALAHRGVKGTGSALAFSFRHWGRPAHGPVPGAIQISARRGGGHVELVADAGMCFNPSSSKQRWVHVPCKQRRNIIGWRIA